MVSNADHTYVTQDVGDDGVHNDDGYGYDDDDDNIGCAKGGSSKKSMKQRVVSVARGKMNQVVGTLGIMLAART
jgi:hypothetical protein